MTTLVFFLVLSGSLKTLTATASFSQTVAVNGSRFCFRDISVSQILSAPRRTRTYNPLIKCQTSGNPNSGCRKDLRIATPPVSHHFPTDTCQTDPDLTAVIHAWDRLPEAVRAGIVAMVRAASKGCR
jgi:hypothetical protein